MRKTGEIRLMKVGGESYSPFIPLALPPRPPIRIEGRLAAQIEAASLAIGRLDTIADILPLDTLLYLFGRQEAVLSSQIEGTQSTLSDLFLFEQGQLERVSNADVRESANYVESLNYGLSQLRELPLSLRLIKETHARLMQQVRGNEKSPGQFRRSQNWIGGNRPGNASYVPPPPEAVLQCMGELEDYLHNSRDQHPRLIRAALVHAQFESIHPFLDGNGRMGRLLITFQLQQERVLTQPLLYLSLYFKQHRIEYYNRLQATRTQGDLEGWVSYFLDAVTSVAGQVKATAQEMLGLSRQVERQIKDKGGRLTGSLLRVLPALLNSPVASIPAIARATDLSYPPVERCLSWLADQRVLEELPSSHPRLFVFNELIELLQNNSDRIDSG